MIQKNDVVDERYEQICQEFFMCIQQLIILFSANINMTPKFESFKLNIYYQALILSLIHFIVIDDVQKKTVFML